MQNREMLLAILVIGLLVWGAEGVALAQGYPGFTDKSYPSDYYRVQDPSGWIHTNANGWIHFGKLGPEAGKPALNAQGFTDRSYPSDYYRPSNIDNQAVRMGQGTGGHTASKAP